MAALRASGQEGLLGPRVWRGGLLGLPTPPKLRNERWQWGKHQVTALKGLSRERATHNVTLWSTDHPRVFCPVGWWLGASAALLLGLCSALSNPKSLQTPKPAGAGQTDGTSESNKVRGGLGWVGRARMPVSSCQAGMLASVQGFCFF